MRLKGGRQILVWIAVPVGAGHPDFLAAKLLAQSFEDADLIRDPVDALPSLGILFYHGLAPKPTHDAIQRYLLLGWESMHFRVGVTLHEVERPDGRLMAFVVGVEVQDMENLWHHTPVVPLIGIPDYRA